MSPCSGVLKNEEGRDEGSLGFPQRRPQKPNLFLASLAAIVAHHGEEKLENDHPLLISITMHVIHGRHSR